MFLVRRGVRCLIVSALEPGDRIIVELTTDAVDRLWPPFKDGRADSRTQVRIPHR